MYAVLGLKAAIKRGLGAAGPAARHFPSFATGAYLGSDVQTMPEAVCVDTGQEVGYGTVPVEKSPVTGGEVRPFLLKTPSGMLSPRMVHDRFYGRAHLVFGWTLREKSLLVPWDHLPDYFAAVCEDLAARKDWQERSLAYVLGWMIHVVSDSLIKGVHPGINLHLVDGRYTPKNRPVQDLVTFHEVGIKELGIPWELLFTKMAATPVEDIQLHYMRCSEPGGDLGQMFQEGWRPDAAATLSAVLRENRRWLSHHAADVLKSVVLKDGECAAEMSAISGLNYKGMVRAAEEAGFHAQLERMGELVADMLEAVAQRSKLLSALPKVDESLFEQALTTWR